MVCREGGGKRFMKREIGIAFGGSLAVIAVAIISLRVDRTSPTIQELRQAGLVIQGRDPSAGSGLCCDLLPANSDDEVHYVTLPAKAWDETQLLKLKRFIHIQQVRADRDVTIEEYELLCRCVIDPNCILVNVTRSSGGRWTGEHDDEHDDE